MADITFLGVEVYRHSADLSSQDRAYCAANAALVYEGIGTSYNDTGLTAGTTYYYKLFAKYDVDGSTYYSSGVSSSAATSVSPPTVSSAVTNTEGTVITITFSKAMANPSGKHAQFSATIAGSSRSISAAALNADTAKFDLTISGAAIASGNTVTISYTAGDVAASDGSPLASFSGQSVTNNVASAYQQWSGYPQSPLLTSSFAHQAIYYAAGDSKLYASSAPMYIWRSAALDGYVQSAQNIKIYRLVSGSWSSYMGDSTSQILSNGAYFEHTGNEFKRANNPIYTNSSLTTVYFAKTT